jgi:hypothetical protein
VCTDETPLIVGVKEQGMTDCSQLQALLDQRKQQRQALDDDPETYCQNQCPPGDVGCIKECAKSIPGRKQALDQDIANIQQEIALCSLFGGTWKITVDITLEGAGHFEGTIDFTGPLSGTITLPGETGIPSTPFIGEYSASTQAIVLRRSFNLDPPSFGDDRSAEVYTGIVDFSTQPPMMMGKMQIDPGPGGVTDLRQYKWSAQKLP